MSNAIQSSPHGAAAKSWPAAARLSPISQALIGVVAAEFILLGLMVFVDGPLALAVQAAPPAVLRAAVIVAGIGKGAYFIGFSLLLFLGALAVWTIHRLRGRRGAAYAVKATGFVLAAAVTSMLSGFLLKFLIGRARPELIGDVGPLAFFPFSTAERLTSFPSGETTMTAAVLVAWMLLAAPRIGYRTAGLILLAPLLIGLSRVLVGAHYLSDVVAAWLLAAAVTYWVQRRFFPSLARRVP